MADESTTTPAPETTSEATTTAPAAETPEVPAGAENPDAVKRALKAERDSARAEKRRADAAEAKLAEREEADKSDLEKANGKASKAEEKAAAAEAKLLRYEVAQEKEVPAKLVPLLTAASREDLEAQADLILENAKPAEATSFDNGPRTTATETKSPEEQHNADLLRLIGRDT